MYDGSKHATLEVSHKLLISFHMQKKQRLGLQRNQIFNQGIFCGGGVGRGGAKLFGELCVPLKKSWLRPWLSPVSRWISGAKTNAACKQQVISTFRYVSIRLLIGWAAVELASEK